MALTVNARTYNLDTFVTPNQVKYTGPANDASVVDTVTLGRTPAKNAVGAVTRSEFKRTLTVVDALGARLASPAIITVITSIPVGTLTAAMTGLVDDVAAWFATTAADDLVVKQDINQ